MRLRAVPVIGMIRSNTKRMEWMVAPIKIAKKTGRVTQTFLTLPSNEIDAGELLDESEVSSFGRGIQKHTKARQS